MIQTEWESAGSETYDCKIISMAIVNQQYTSPLKPFMEIIAVGTPDVLRGQVPFNFIAFSSVEFSRSYSTIIQSWKDGLILFISPLIKQLLRYVVLWHHKLFKNKMSWDWNPYFYELERQKEFGWNSWFNELERLEKLYMSNTKESITPISIVGKMKPDYGFCMWSEFSNIFPFVFNVFLVRKERVQSQKIPNRS